MRRLAGWLSVLSVAAAIVAAPALAAAPPSYVSSEPEAGSGQHQAPGSVKISFDQPLDGSSTLVVLDECGNQISDGDGTVSGTDLTTTISVTPIGRYRMVYLARGIAGVTGEREGELSFVVHAGKPCGGDDGSGGHGGHGTGNGSQNGGGKGGNHSGHDPGTAADGSGDHPAGGHATSGTASQHASGAGHTGATGTHTAAGGTHGNGENGGSKHNQHDVQAAENDLGITSSDTVRQVLTRADSAALLVALAICVILGVLGGGVLRASAR